MHGEINALVDLVASLLDVVWTAQILHKSVGEKSLGNKPKSHHLILVAGYVDGGHVEGNAVHAGAAAKILRDLNDDLLAVGG